MGKRHFRGFETSVTTAWIALEETLTLAYRSQFHEIKLTRGIISVDFKEFQPGHFYLKPYHFYR